MLPAMQAQRGFELLVTCMECVLADGMPWLPGANCWCCILLDCLLVRNGGCFSVQCMQEFLCKAAQVIALSALRCRRHPFGLQGCVLGIDF